MSGRRIVYGIGPVTELLTRHAKELECLFVSEKRLSKGKSDPIAKLVGTAKNVGLRWNAVASADLDRFAAGGRHQGVVAITGTFPYQELDQIVERAKEPGLLVALDGVTDPHNLGAIVRSALLLGVDGLVVPRDRAAGVTPLVTKASAGATEHLPIAQVTNLVRALEELKQQGYWSAAIAASSRAQSIETFDSSMPLVLVLGAEGKGIRHLVAKTCDFHLEIPMATGAIGSFNVSVAAALAIYEVQKRRRV